MLLLLKITEVVTNSFTSRFFMPQLSNSCSWRKVFAQPKTVSSQHPRQDTDCNPRVTGVALHKSEFALTEAHHSGKIMAAEQLFTLKLGGIRGRVVISFFGPHHGFSATQLSLKGPSVSLK